MTSSPISTARPQPKPWLRGLIVSLVGCLALSTLGCAFGEIRIGDPFDRQYTLEEAQHRYTVLVRFSEFEKARSFVVKDERDNFMRRMKKSLKDARFTGYESDTVEVDAEKQAAIVRVTYTIYTPAMPYEVEVSEVQEWKRSGLSNNWQVTSTFDGLQEFAAN